MLSGIRLVSRDKVDEGQKDEKNTRTSEENKKEECGNGTGLQREAWMTMPMDRSFHGDVEKKCKNGEKIEKESEGDLKRSALELNPYFKDGGTGLPPEKAGTMSQETDGTDTNLKSDKAVPVRQSVGDGGASWRMKALRRAQSQAASDGIPLEQVVKDRWGSIGDLAAGIAKSDLPEKRPAHSMAHLHAARERKREHGKVSKERVSPWQEDAMIMEGETEKNGSRSRHRHSHTRRHESKEELNYLEDVRSSRGRMKRPVSSESSLSWRKSESRRHSQKKKGSTDSFDDIAVLESSAAKLNSFSNDGSFLDQFENLKSKGKLQEEKIGNEIPALSPRQGKSSPHRLEHIEEKSEQKLQGRDREHQDLLESKKPSTNKSAAAMLRARLGGGINHESGAGSSHQRGVNLMDKVPKEVQLPLIDSQGKAVPGAFGREKASETTIFEDKSFKSRKMVERYDVDGQKARYYADDDSTDLNTLVKRTKYEGAANINNIIAKNIVRDAKFRDKDLMDHDAEYDYDVGLELADPTRKPSKRARRRGDIAGEAAAKDRQKQIREYHKYQSAMDRCRICFASSLRPKHLLISVGNESYLSLPETGRLTPGHCCIAPAEHVACVRIADDNIYTEIRNFKKCLLLMFQSQGMDVIFVETALHPESNRSHAVVECIPMPHEGEPIAFYYSCFYPLQVNF